MLLLCYCIPRSIKLLLVQRPNFGEEDEFIVEGG